MVTKLDLNRVCDKIIQDFLEFMLQIFGFPEHFIRLILKCVSTTTISIVCNGEISTPFTSMRGLRLGDPVSPLPFVHCCSGLTVLILKIQNLGNWKGVNFGHNSLWIIHMAFADDIVLFG